MNHRDRAVLRAVAAGRCVLHGAHGAVLRVDGLCCADQFAGARLTAAGLIVAFGRTGPAQLTAAGHALLDAA
ncbi:MAG: hypothetical protein L0H64_02455 [Pseudonocardia sp.]|nr:hypothetical protein [Pseudonocardia sp.]